MSDYPYGLDVRPLTTWPGALTPHHERRRSPFSATLRSTLSQLWVELRAIGADRPVLEVAIDESQFRLDGRPRSTAKAEHPGVVLSLPRTDVGPLRYATDLFTTWQDNLRAITLGLEALRKVDRYGITRRGEQYAGFKAIGSGIAMPGAAAVQMTVDEAAQVLSDLACDALGDPTAMNPNDVLADGGRYAYRVAAKVHHPDVGGDRAKWDRLEQAKHVLDTHGASRG